MADHRSAPKSRGHWIERIGKRGRIVERICRVGICRVGRDGNSGCDKRAPEKEAVMNGAVIKKTMIEGAMMHEEAVMREAGPGEESRMSEAETRTRRKTHRRATRKTPGGCLTNEQH